MIHIRDGKEPLPHQPHRNFWDLYIADGVAPRGFAAPSSILARMVQAQFTDEEMELLEEAKRQSDALIDLEDVAYNAMKGRFRPGNTTGLMRTEARAFSVIGRPNQTLAMQLVHSTDYHVLKGKIMRPIDQVA